MERLQKVLAQANVASRRKAEELILEKKVKVNGKIVSELGFKVSRKDQIEVDGKPIEFAPLCYYLLNKPTGYLSTVSDDKKRRTILDLFEPEDKENRIYPVGRLDYDTAGLLLVTNDGELTKKLTHPTSEIAKQYLVRVKGIVIKDKIRKLREGVIIDDNYLAVPKEVQLMELDKKNQSTLIRIIITEGKNKQVRKMMEAIGHPVKNLTRDQYAFLNLEGVKRGTYRKLKLHEVKQLKNL
ncbi:rRNA pseudouridylate synthase [Alteracholeplasma palmae J233]|uniref:Pseudouridine synthase n=1 Tax=Alteracholeplasma palmae (strain ATCC 49389 / J233) TaxID=1318466 RepID=U4KKT7_ALTPJ|nr:pseudouridine synthase [Alteracholeplasma palmae]CCV64302.1 rRNA pseudouridylate synthase [Alteracholeplasma palmae J233]